VILSEEGIKRAIKDGQLGITPAPQQEQYTTSAVDLCLGMLFQGWAEAGFKVPGARVELNLAEQKPCRYS